MLAPNYLSYMDYVVYIVLDPIPYDLSWNRHTQKPATARSKHRTTNRPAASKHQKTNTKKTLCPVPSASDTLRHRLGPTASKKRSRSPDADVNGDRPQAYPSAGLRHHKTTSPERTKPADLHTSPEPHTCSSALSTPDLPCVTVHPACPTPETRLLHATSDIDRTDANSVYTHCVNIPHFNHVDHQMATSVPCPAIASSELLVSSSFCTAEPLTSNDYDYNTILDYDKRIADS